MNTESSSEIGGYFGLDLPDFGNPFPDSFIKFQSGRAALRAVLECSDFERVRVPAYICDSVIQAVIDSGKKVELYDLNEHLYPKGLPAALSKDCALLYVNYFGLCQKNITLLLRDIPNHQLIIDNTQALLEPPTNALATFYSPRKFVGVPDGGLLITSGQEITIPTNEDTSSIDRMKHLLLRMAYTARDGYSCFIDANESLNNTSPLGMSRLTRRILASVNMSAVRTRRRENFIALASALDKYNLYRWELTPESVPLCYPLVLNRNMEDLRKQLADRQIYIPTYWRNARRKNGFGRMENILTDFSLAVPCDQRYFPEQLDHAVDLILSELHRN